MASERLSVYWMVFHLGHVTWYRSQSNHSTLSGPMGIFESHDNII